MTQNYWLYIFIHIYIYIFIYIYTLIYTHRQEKNYISQLVFDLASAISIQGKIPYCCAKLQFLMTLSEKTYHISAELILPGKYFYFFFSFPLRSDPSVNQTYSITNYRFHAGALSQYAGCYLYLSEVFG